MVSRIKFKVEDRNYNDWDLYDYNSLNKIDKTQYNIHPIEHKLLNQDIINVDESGNLECIVHSSIRSLTVIPGVLVLEKNKTFGKVGNKYYYKFIPDDKRIPFCLVPYFIKQMGFSKNKSFINKYTICKFKSWDKNEKHPVMEIVNIIGEVSKLESFYEYQLYCKSLKSSIQSFTKKSMKIVKERTEQTIIEDIITKYNCVDHRHLNVFSIDPKGCKDIDDAVSIQKTDTGYCLNIYIANVPLWLDVLDLWESFSNRISTIYLPDRRRPMMPTILSDCLCSLREKQTRFAFNLQIDFNECGEIVETRFLNCIVCLHKNYAYNEDSLINSDDYSMLDSLIRKSNTYFKYHEELKDSHDIVAYLMILMNYYCAKEFIKIKNGIFRTIKLNGDAHSNANLPKNVKKFLKGWQSSGGKYLMYDNYDGHDLLELEAYVHITSPIRRLVDLLNIYNMQVLLNINSFSNEGKHFYEMWTSEEKIDYINTSMRAIRKVQTTCDLLAKFTNTPELFNEEFTGYIFDKVIRNDKLYQYSVYVPELHMIQKYIYSEEFDMYSEHKFKMYLFSDEGEFKRKILLQVVH